MKFLLIILLLNTSLFSQTGSITGKITDGTKPIPSVNIFLMETTYGTVADADGNYRLSGIPQGKYEVRYSAVGYETKFYTIEIRAGSTIELNVDLPSAIIEVGEVRVIGSKEQRQSDTRTSLIDLSPESAKVLPGAGEDVLRTLQAMPGVLAPNDFTSQLIVRGSGPDQNLIIMDDVEIFNPYRLYGAISMFNPDVVTDINLVTGGFQSQYGDRLSAVLDVTNREGTTDRYFKGMVNANILSANIVLEGKEPFGLKGSWLLTTRRTYYDLIIEPFVKSAGLVEDDVSFPNFFDVQGKLAFGPFNGHKFLINGIFSRDGVDVVTRSNNQRPDSINVFNVTRNEVVSAAWHYTPNKNFLNKTIFSWYRNKGLTDFDSKVLDPSINREQFKDFIPDTLAGYLLGIKFNTDFSFQKFSFDDKLTYLWGNHVFEAGAGIDIMETLIEFNVDLDPQLRARITANPNTRAALNNLKESRFYNKYRAFVQNNFKILDNLYIQPGLRFDYYDILNKQYLAPRLSLSYAIDNLTTLRAVWGIYYQSPGYEKIVDQGVLFDFNRKYTEQLDAERSIHYVLGLERWLSGEWNIRLEGYYKGFDNLIVSKSVPGLKYVSEPIPGGDIRYPSGWTTPVAVPTDSLTQVPVNESYGEAYGFELLLAKRNNSPNDVLSGWISYSLAYANRYENSEIIPFRFDQRHTINVVLNYKANNWLDIGIRWQYGSGFPFSEPDGVRPRILLADTDGDFKPDTPVLATRRSAANPDDPAQVILDIDYGNSRNKFNSRKPTYHRLDVRLNALTNFWGLDWNFYLDVINVYNRSNIIAYSYFINPDNTLGRRPNKMFPIIPTFGFSVNF